MLWTLNRFYEDKELTLGCLVGENFTAFTLELPWRFNKKEISRIPAGHYSLRKIGGTLKRIRITNQYVVDSTAVTPEVLSAAPRFNCDLHTANYVTQIKGCVAVGTNVSRDEAMVTHSRIAMNRLFELVADNDELLIKDNF